MCNNAEFIEYIHIETNENKPAEKKLKKFVTLLKLLSIYRYNEV